MDVAADFRRLLAVEPRGGDRFLGAPGGAWPRRTFGGLIAAQALAAAARTADARPCHALHLLYLAPGDADAPITYTIERLRDGGSFTARQVSATQDGRELARALLSFHAGADGPRHAVAMPTAPAPDAIAAKPPADPDRRFLGDLVLDIRAVEPGADRPRGVEGRRQLWVRAREALGDEPATHQAALAFASDLGLVHTGLQPHRDSGAAQRLDATSLDHSVRFHAPLRADAWFLFDQRSPVAEGGRGFSTGAVYGEDGRLAASVSQELLARYARAVLG